MKKVFTKLNLQQDYNNVQIKEKDEQKTVFTISEGLFEPTIIFFELINFPAIFQTIINEIL